MNVGSEAPCRGGASLPLIFVWRRPFRRARGRVARRRHGWPSFYYQTANARSWANGRATWASSSAVFDHHRHPGARRHARNRPWRRQAPEKRLPSTPRLPLVAAGSKNPLISRERGKCLPNGTRASKRLPSQPRIPTGYRISAIRRGGNAVRSIPCVGLWKTDFWTVYGPFLDLV